MLVTVVADQGTGDGRCRCMGSRVGPREVLCLVGHMVAGGCWWLG